MLYGMPVVIFVVWLAVSTGTANPPLESVAADLWFASCGSNRLLQLAVRQQLGVGTAERKQ